MLARPRRLGAAGLAAGVVCGLAGAAVAASSRVKPSAHFKGSGGDYMNNAPKWTKRGAGKLTFNTSTDGQRILDFHGAYQFYCGGGTGVVTGSSLTISMTGRFSARGHYQERNSHGAVTGTNYLKVWGRVATDGKSVTINYLSDFVYAGQTVTNPYSTKIKSRTKACESWVRGRATPTTG